MKPGSRLKSAVCETEIVVIKAPKLAVVLACGGAPMIPIAEQRSEGGAPAGEWAGGSLLGKRYADEESGLEALCSKGGAGTLSVDGRRVTIRESKKLPSSD